MTPANPYKTDNRIIAPPAPDRRRLYLDYATIGAFFLLALFFLLVASILAFPQFNLGLRLERAGLNSQYVNWLIDFPPYALSIIAPFLYIIWAYVSHYELDKYFEVKTSAQHSSILYIYFLVPSNLVRPYRYMQEMYQGYRSLSHEEEVSPPVSRLILVWWVCFWITAIMTIAELFLGFLFTSFNGFMQALYFLPHLTALLSLAMIVQICRYKWEAYDIKEP